ncbi:oxidoreductase, short chain dehydrogenase/reductase family [Sporothrix schenckii 1099-18]|uniref:Oxidoreductase, short chain dehydrogenase/reductase family n=1 Tax=Sporothrix schenckii 1099-18 TaxID=1397361 RepID=A0A0F2M2X4_SPOSC|nr:oxidoreductase, short chain dehydrogenase/reductase family [Sporothrix schenckii 1099-18]KJR82486.1 oxidoreductase, short chain dehydrogenase/reductase family [Sporothrix schenckii 1099-18]
MLAVDDKSLPEALKAMPHSGLLVTPHAHHDTYDAISPKNIDLAGKAVLITGASRGIGRHIAISYARAGASQIAIAARGDSKETEAAVLAAAAAAGRPAPTLLAIPLDTTDVASVDAAVATLTKAFGRLDILVNNAGVLEPVNLLGDSDPLAWWRTFEVNIKGVYLVSRAVLPLLFSSPDGSRTIVNLTSIGGLLVLPTMSGYNTSKLAVCRLTEYLAAEYADKQLVAMAVHPGGVASDMSLSLPKVYHANITETPALVSDSIVYLTRSPQLWLAGRYVSVQWDLTELEAQKDEIVQKDLLKSKLAV